MSCENARTLVMSYLDGELSEEQAAPLRSHLFDCRQCREVAKEGKSLGRWFVDFPGAVQVPAGFAARVARRAFAGDVGSVPLEEVAAATPRASMLPFLLGLTSVAAGLLFAFAIAIQKRELPAGDGVDALGPPPWEREAASPPEAYERDLPAELPGAPDARPQDDDHPPQGPEAPEEDGR